MAQNQNTTKKKTTTRKTRRTPKPKVYIPAYKIIIFCVVIITICMGLLLATSLMSEPKQESISDRYNSKKTEKVEDIEEKKKEALVEKKKVTPKPTKKEDKKETVKTEKEKTQQKKEDVKPKVEEKKTTPTVEKEKPIIKEDAKPKVEEKKESAKSFGFPVAQNGAQLIFVFDDGGHSLSQAEKFLALPFPYTVAVLPRLKFSKETADLIRKSGNEVILHQPMQAINLSVDPGPGAITPDMDENQIISTLFQNVTEIGPIAGMNNHEGSAITADAEKMATVLRFTSQEGIYFLDSRTNKDTAVPYVAKELGYSYYERNIFLDNEKTRDNILSELKKALGIANKKGNVIMIGHVWSSDILPAVLIEVYPELKEKGYTFSTVSKSKAKIN